MTSRGAVVIDNAGDGVAEAGEDSFTAKTKVLLAGGKAIPISSLKPPPHRDAILEMIDSLGSRP